MWKIEKIEVRINKDGSSNESDLKAANQLEEEGYERYDAIDQGDYRELRYRKKSDS